MKLKDLKSYRGKRFNGKSGTIVQNKTNGRYEVKIGKAKPYAIKTENLTLHNVTYCCAISFSRRQILKCEENCQNTKNFLLYFQKHSLKITRKYLQK